MHKMALMEPVVSGMYPESGPGGGRAVYMRLMKTSPEPCQGCPGMIRRNHWTAVIREEPGREMAPCPALRDE